MAQKKRALLVEDDAATQAALRAWLVRDGWVVDAVADGASARTRVAEGGFDAILLDFGLPDVDGAVLVREWRATGVTTPILAVTGAESDMVIEELLRAGAHDVVEKYRLTRDRFREALASLEHPPAFPASRKRLARGPAEAEDAPPVVVAGRALIVDDVATVRRLLRTMLEAEGWTVDEAPNATQGLRAALSEPHDVMILDYLLPDVDGAGLLHELRRRGDATPVVVVTAHGGESLASEFLLGGAAAFVPKEGLTRAALLAAIAEARVAADARVAPAAEASHWESVHAENEDDDVSWTQREPATSLALLARCSAGPDVRIVDVGCGAGGLAVALVERGWRHVTGVDIAASAIRRAREKLGAQAAKAAWVVADVRDLAAKHAFDVWHDRAVFHFLVDEPAREAYRASLRRNLRVNGHAVIGTFALDGPDRCSGLPVARYDPEGIVGALGPGFVLVHGQCETHVTPWGSEQRFSWALARRVS